MADPIVTITNGVPTSSSPATGVITTLGQTLLDGANVTYGATTDLAVTAGAAGSISAKLRSISRDIVGGIVLQPGANVIGAVTQSGGPWSVSGTIAATQSGAWNITNITGTVSLPTGAATSALQPTNAALASTTAGQTGNLDLGAVTTSAPSYANGTTNALSLTTTGGLRVDGSGVTQPVSGTVAISGTVAVTESGTWTVQPGNTANTVPWLFTIQQGGNPATVSAAGALKVDGSAATQPISAAALPLPAGAATAALQPTNAAQGSTTSGQTGPLVQGAVATSAPTYTNGQTSPISLTTAGAIRVDGSGATWAVSGTVTANQGGTWNQRLQDGSGNAITSDARGTARPLAVEILDASGNQIVSFGAGSGPSFGSAFPATGQAIGVKDSTGVNMVALNANASGALKVDGSAVTQPVSGTFWQATQPVSGTFWQATQPVSAASLPLPSGASTSANQPSNAAIGSTTSGQTGGLAMGAVTTGLPSYTTAQTDPLSLTPSGLLRVDGSNVTQPISGTVSISGTLAVTQSGTWNITNISGTISLPTGAATSANQPTNAALGSTTTGSTGTISLGAVTTGAPAYTTGQNNALSLTTAGALRVDGSAVTQPISGSVTASQGGTWTVQPGNTANTTPWLMTIQQGGNAASVTASNALKVDGSAVTQPISGTITANQGGNWTDRIVGNAGGIMDFAGQNAAQPGSALLIGGEFNTTPTTISSGNASPLQIDNAGNLKVNVVAGGAAGGGTSSAFGSAFPASGTAMGAEYLSSPPTLTSGNMAALQLTSAGSLHITLDNAIPTGSNFIGNMFPYAAVSTAAPSYTTGTNNLLSLNVNGGLRVDGSGVTQPVSGTITANIGTSGSLALESGGNLASIKTDVDNLNLAQASTTSGQKGNLVLAAATTAAPSYTTAQSNPLSMNLSGGLRVDGSGVTQPVSGTFWQATQPVSGTFWQATQPVSIAATVNVSAAQSGNWTSRIVGNAGVALDAAQNAAAPANELVMGGVYNSVAPTITSGNASQLQLDNNGNLNVNIKAGAGSGGTASSFGATFPATGTAAGAEYLSTPPSLTTGQMVALQVTSAGSLHTTIDNTPAVTISGTVAATQSGSWNVGQTGTWQMNPLNSVSWGIMSSTQNQAPIANCVFVGGQYNSSPTTITSGNTSPLQLNASGSLRVDGSGVTQPISAASLPLPSGASTSALQPTNAAAASTTSGQTGNLAMAAVTTAVPSYTTATTNFLSMTPSGGLRVDGSSVTQPVSGTVTSRIQGSLGTILDAAQNAAPPANALNIGGTYNSTPPSITSGNFGQLQLNATGSLRVDGSAVTQPVSGTVTANLGTIAGVATSANQPTNAAAASTTAGQSGTLAFAAVNSGTPAYTSATSQPLNIDTAGNLKVNALNPSVYNAGAAWTSATAVNTTAGLAINPPGTYESIVGQITTTSTITGGQITFEESYDNGTTYVNIPPQRLVDPTTYVPISNPVTLVASTNLHFHIIPSTGTVIRARLSTVIAGTGSSTVSWTQSLTSAVDLTNTICAGDTANGSTDGGWPVKIGGVASTSTTPAAVTNGQRVNAQFDIHGKQICIGAVRSNKSSVYTTLSTTTETTIVGATLNVFNDLYGLIIANTSASAAIIDFRTTTGGPIVATLIIPAGDSRGFMLGVDSAFPQVSVNTNWTAQLRGAVTSVYITALFVQNN